ncbi:MAG: hypothetical protein Q4Q26_06965, partial [Eubacteriales bacterium]|nr:hypothetical protein [Eubacteriales bacterium]
TKKKPWKIKAQNSEKIYLPVGGGNSSQLPNEKGSDRANQRMINIIATNAWRSIREDISILLPGFLYFYSL